LISGPNAGGKSVCLKTVGLLQYSIQCGIPVPLHLDSVVGIFEKIFIDIGDNQSLDNDLSTYSSHLSDMKFFVRNCNPQSLVLIDEFGTGTEPMLGGAIAESILNRINQLKSYGVITTHYTNLKHFASSVEGIVNGAMLYDSNKMEPLFQLQIGKPGSSFAFEIARKIGLPEDILQEATIKIGKDHIDFDKHLRDIVRDKRYWETKRQNIRQSEKKLEDLTSTYEENLSEVKKLRKEILDKAKKEAAELLASSNKIVEQTIREIKEASADKEKTREAR
jgi:DNA mismatch repair protein MutS2